MNDELKQLIEDAAKLLGLEGTGVEYAGGICIGFRKQERTFFNPLNPERGDLWKVAEAAKVVISYYDGWVRYVTDRKYGQEHFLIGNHQSLALAILRAASAVLHSRGGV